MPIVVTLPDLREYAHHRTETDASFEGVPVPGLTAEFYRRPDGGRFASAGLYSYGGRELLMAWGFADEEHCRHSAVRDPAGGWFPPSEGCPVVRVLRTGRRPGDPVAGVAVRTPTGRWITAGAQENVSADPRPAAPR